MASPSRYFWEVFVFTEDVFERGVNNIVGTAFGEGRILIDLLGGGVFERH
jgi:hypothetical protein